jgi:hypothetical protein
MLLRLICEYQDGIEPETIGYVTISPRNVDKIEELWQEFKKTEPAFNHHFIQFLVDKGLKAVDDHTSDYVLQD